MSTYEHLDEKAIAELALSLEERANRMLAERFFTHDRLEPIFDHVHFLLHRPPMTRASGLIVSGKPGSGKTMLARAILRKYPAEGCDEGRPSRMPVVGITMTGAREAKTLYNRLLTQLGVPDVGRYAGSDRERMVLKTCRAADVRLLIVDEVQDVLTSTPRQQRIALDTIKYLMNELSLPILALGTSHAPDAMRVDEHLNARFSALDLPIWRQNRYLRDLLDAIERVLPLKKPSLLSSLPLSNELLKLSDGILDPIMRLITYAAAHAVESGEEQITLKGLQRAKREPPVAVLRMAKDAGERPREAA